MTGLQVSSHHLVSTDNLDLQAMQSDGAVAHSLSGLGNPAGIDSEHLPGSVNHHQEGGANPLLANPAHRSRESPASSVTNFEDCVPLSGDDLSAIDVRDPIILGKQLMSLLSDNQSKVPVATREKIMGLFFDMQGIIVGLKTNLARADGRIEELRAQLVEVKSHCESPSGPKGTVVSPALMPTFVEAVRGSCATHANPARSEATQRTPAGAFALQQSNAVGPNAHLAFYSNPNHVLLLSPVVPSANPGPDTITLLKSTFGNDPSGIGVRQVKLIPSRSGLTVVSADRESIDNLEKAIASNVQIKTALKVSRPPRRLPQFKISGVDPSILPGILRANINARNNLAIPEDGFRHRTNFRDRAGNNVHIIEVSPAVYGLLKNRDRLLIGWTSCPIKENFYVAACQKCCSYGHVSTRCPNGRITCPYCAEEHSAAACNLENKNNVVCRECRAAGKERFAHTFNAPCCEVLSARIARLRAKTIYEEITPVSPLSA